GCEPLVDLLDLGIDDNLLILGELDVVNLVTAGIRVEPGDLIPFRVSRVQVLQGLTVEAPFGIEIEARQSKQRDRYSAPNQKIKISLNPGHTYSFNGFFRATESVTVNVRVASSVVI